jgi:copper(I)-binding protein
VKKLLLSLLLTMPGAALLSLAASAAGAAPVDVSGAWFRALPGHLPAGGYFTAVNSTRDDIAITGAQSDGCGMLMIHQSRNKGGMSGMDMLDKVIIPAGGTVKFAPGGYHLMCTDPTAKLKIGARVPVVLDLSNGVRIAVAFTVLDARGK